MRCSCAFERAICFVYNLICYIVSSRKLLFIFCRQGRVYLLSYHKYIISDYYYYSYFIDKALSIRCVFFVMSCNLWYCQIFSPTKNRFFCRSKWFFRRGPTRSFSCTCVVYENTNNMRWMGTITIFARWRCSKFSMLYLFCLFVFIFPVFVFIQYVKSQWNCQQTFFFRKFCRFSHDQQWPKLKSF